MGVILIGMLAAALGPLANAEQCNEKACITKHEAPPEYQHLYPNDGPCLIHNEQHLCMFELGRGTPCNCSISACQCEEFDPDSCVPNADCLTRDHAPEQFRTFFKNDEEKCVDIQDNLYCFKKAGGVASCDCKRSGCKCAQKESENPNESGSGNGSSESDDANGSGSNESEEGSNDEAADDAKCNIKDIPSEYAGKQEEYCEKYGSDHTMCKPDTLGPKCAGGVCIYGMRQDQQNAMVNKHNMFRRKVAKGEETSAYGSDDGQPSAANMKKMRWNDELARVAGKHLRLCDFSHDLKRDVPGIGYVGQNAFIFLANEDSDIDVTLAIDKWYLDEVVNFSPKDVNPYSEEHKKPGKDAKVGHYTQIVWANTDQVGCAYIKYKEEGMYKHLVTCNYGPGGNMGGGVPMYIEGEAGSACPGQVDDGLCL